MARQPKLLSTAFTFSGWVSSVLPNVWGAMITASGGVLILWLTAGVRIFTSPDFIGAALIFVLILWTYIGIVWLSIRKPSDVKTLRYGITFEGIQILFNPHNADSALSFSLTVRNYSPVPILYKISEFDVHLDTRTLQTKYIPNSLQAFLSRGAGRSSSAIPFRLEHIKEFFGRRIEGTLDFCIVYGDADKQPVRRLRMSHKLILDFTQLPSFDTSTQGVLPGAYSIGFNATIEAEADERFLS